MENSATGKTQVKPISLSAAVELGDPTPRNDGLDLTAKGHQQAAHALAAAPRLPSPSHGR